MTVAQVSITDSITQQPERPPEECPESQEDEAEPSKGGGQSTKYRVSRRSQNKESGPDEEQYGDESADKQREPWIESPGHTTDCTSVGG